MWSQDDEGGADGEGDEDDDGSLVFPAAYALAVADVLALDPKGTGAAVKDLKVGSDEEKLQLALTLWSVGAVRTLEWSRNNLVMTVIGSLPHYTVTYLLTMVHTVKDEWGWTIRWKCVA